MLDLGDGTYDVRQWSDVFVTSGAMYVMAHDSEHNLYGLPYSESESPVVINAGHGKGNGEIETGRAARQGREADQPAEHTPMEELVVEAVVPAAECPEDRSEEGFDRPHEIDSVFPAYRTVSPFS